MASVDLNDFIPEGCIGFFSGSSFVDAASTASSLLVNAGVTRDSYPAEVKQIIENQGPYMVIAPGVAIVHGRPDANSTGSALSILVCDSDLISGNKKNDPVRVVFAISATSNETHLQMLQTLSEFLLVEGTIEKLQLCSTVSEVRQLLTKNLT